MGYTMSFIKADNGMNFPASRDHNKSGEGECKPKTAEVLYCNFKPVGQAWSLFQARMNLRLMISLPGRRHSRASGVYAGCCGRGFNENASSVSLYISSKNRMLHSL